jgi:hypothetical protein
MATLGRVDWLNNHRLLGPLGYITLAEREANYFAPAANLDMAAVIQANRPRTTLDGSVRHR